MDILLCIEGLKTYYYSKGRVVPAVDGVDLTLARGETLGIVGESGCGKSTVARSILGLLDKSYTRIESGSILFHGKDLTKLPNREMNRIRGKQISMIFQNPLTSLNPVFTIGSQIEEILRIHEQMTNTQMNERCIELLTLVGIPAAEQRVFDFPHQLSGGMQQRVMIAIALACNPELLIADEPTTALDVTIQAQILDLIRGINKKFGTGMILITHNMGVVAEMCDRVMVMYGGVIVEEGNIKDLYEQPMHPYTQGLLAAIPSIDEDKEELFTIEGTVPRFSHPVTCCRFSDRCSKACPQCFEAEPPLIALLGGRKVRCILYEQGGDDH